MVDPSKITFYYNIPQSTSETLSYATRVPRKPHCQLYSIGHVLAADPPVALPYPLCKVRVRSRVSFMKILSRKNAENPGY